MAYADRHLWNSAVSDVQTAADKAHFVPLNRVVVHKIGVYVIGTDAGGATVKVDKINKSETRGDGDIGTLTIPAADTSFELLYEVLSTPVVLEPGEIAVFEVTAEGVTALNVVYCLEYSINDMEIASATNATAA